MLRAMISDSGLGAMDVEEAYYPMVLVDANGDDLQGTQQYRFTFAAGNLPPVKYFWSLTMYDGKFRLVDNPINRYSIGDRTQGLNYESDGSLVIVVQSEPPEDPKANWLPSPATGQFFISMRAYGPQDRWVNGSYDPPPVMRVE